MGALSRLPEIDPANVGVKLRIAELHLSQKRYGAAHGALTGIQVVSPKDAPRLFRARALIYDGMKMPGEAQAAADSAWQFAKAWR